MNGLSVLFSKIIAVIMSFFYMFIGGNPNSVDVSLVDQPTTESTCIEYKVTNYSGTTMFIDKYFSIEQKVDDEWTPLPFTDDAATEDIAIRLLNCQSITLSIDLMRQYGHTLDEGEYKLILPYVTQPLEFTV